MKLPFTPKWIRAGKAGAYLGMDRNRFNVEVRPHLRELAKSRGPA